MENLGVKRGRYENIWEFYSQPRSFQGLLHFWANLCNAWYWNVGYNYIYTYIYIHTTHGWFEMPISFFSICLCELIQKFNALIYLYNRQKPNGLRLYTVYPTAPKKLTESNGDMRQHDITPESPGLWSIRRTSMPCMSRVFDQESANGGLMVISWLFNGGWMV